MVAELKPAKRLDQDDISDLVRTYVRQGKTAAEAARAIIDDMRAIGRADELLDAAGTVGIVALWRASGEKVARPKIVHQPIEPAMRPGAPPQRRLEMAALKNDASLLEGMYQINGRWQRIGDLDKAACRAAALTFKNEALEKAQVSRYFHALAQALNGGETVRQRFDDDGLMRLWADAGRGS